MKDFTRTKVPDLLALPGLSFRSYVKNITVSSKVNNSGSRNHLPGTSVLAKDTSNTIITNAYRLHIMCLSMKKNELNKTYFYENN